MQSGLVGRAAVSGAQRAGSEAGTRPRAWRLLACGAGAGACALALSGYLGGRARDPEAKGEAAARLEREQRLRQRQQELAQLSEQASWRRLAQLIVALLPVAMLWPIWLFDPAFFWHLVASRLESCGPCFVKLSQWLATRRDLFPEAVCDALSSMHSTVTACWAPPVSRERVEAALKEARLCVKSLELRPHASGSIAEVFFGVLQDGTAVAIKCLRPGVRELLAADLAWLLRFGAWAESSLRLRMLGIRRAAEDFCEHVQMQTNFLVEASHLSRFRRNFAESDELVRFPTPLFASQDMLVMSREEGQELAQIFAVVDGRGGCPGPTVPGVQEALTLANVESIREVLGSEASLGRTIARESVACYMRMIFHDAFIHGDLHPGNIMLRLRGGADGAGAAAATASAAAGATGPGAGDAAGAACAAPGPEEAGAEGGGEGWLRRARRRCSVAARRLSGTSPPRFELVILDAGLAIPLPKDKVEALRSLAIAIIYGDYFHAAEILYEQSPDTSGCWDPVAFKSRLAAAFEACRKNIWEEGFVQVSEACLQALHLVQHYNVGLDTTLTWALFGMLSVEGSAKRLDPEVDAAEAATKYIITVGSVAREFGRQSSATCWRMLLDAITDKLGLK